MSKSRRNRLRNSLERFLTFGHISKIPQRQILFGYLYYILAGTILLTLPFATKVDVDFLDNLFTITSAVSTTGLGTVGTSDSYTYFGQAVILLMIQLGGVGYMTLTSFVFFRMTHHFMRIKKDVLKTAIAVPESIELKNLVQGIVTFTILFETIGTIFLYASFLDAGVEVPLWSAIFHSVSAFCTAGFSLYSDSLVQFQSDFGVNLIISILSYAGAMGFIVIHDIWAKIHNWKYKVTFTSRVIVMMTLLVTLIGSVQLFFLEPVVASMPLKERLMASVFQTMSAMTTVGFNTISLSNLMPSTLMILILAMYIGASPSGTGGGLKSTTITTAYAFVKSKLGLQRDVTLWGHRLPTYRLDTALTTFVFYTSILVLGLYLLMLTENAPMEVLLFEASSALGTVGLSTGLTPNLTSSGKMILISMMYIGRIGVLTFGSSMVIRMARKAKLSETADDDLAV